MERLFSRNAADAQRLRGGVGPAGGLDSHPGARSQRRRFFAPLRDLEPQGARVYLGMSRMAVTWDIPLEFDLVPSAGLRDVAAFALQRGRADRVCATLGSSESAARRVMGARSLWTLGDPRALSFLVRHATRSGEPDPEVRVAAREEALRFVGYGPREGLGYSLDSHRHGVLTPPQLKWSAVGE